MMNDESVKEKLPLCKCGAPGRDAHPCPYRIELYNDDKFECHCCKKCRNDCAADV